MSFLSSRSKTLPDTDDQSDEPDPRRRRRVLLAWTFVIIWAAVIWTLGGDAFSASETGSRLAALLRWFGGELTPSQRLKLLMAIRKSAHLVEYAILALLTFRAAWLSAGGHQITTAAWSAVFLVATLATADEARQAFSPARTGSPIDVLIDITGGTIAIVGLLYVMRRFRRDREIRS